MASFVGKVHAQLNEYKYIVVPKRLDGFKKDNQHQTSTLVKHLFANKGFEAVYENSLPEDLTKNRCLGLYVGLDDGSSTFTTNTILVLKDCTDKEVFVTQQGRSKKKEYKDAYKEALTEAFKSFDGVNYKYAVKSAKEEPITISFKNDVKKLEEKPKLDTNQDPMVKQEATIDDQSYKNRSPVKSDIKKADEDPKKMIEQKATREEQRFKDHTPVQSDFKKAQSSMGDSKKMVNSKQTILYAQELSNGYQLVDSTPEIRFRIYKSSMPNVYLAKASSKDGLVYTVDGKWFFEYSENGNLVVEELNIKF